MLQRITVNDLIQQWVDVKDLSDGLFELADRVDLLELLNEDSRMSSEELANIADKLDMLADKYC